MPWHVSINVLCVDRERLRPRMQRYRDGFPREGTCLPPHSRVPTADVPGAFASKLGRGDKSMAEGRVSLASHKLPY